VQYFFHVIGDGIHYEDDSGESFPSVETAIAFAHVIAAELRSDEPKQWHAVTVIGEGGNEVARVAIKGAKV
jgi:hypothetical protein